MAIRMAALIVAVTLVAAACADDPSLSTAPAVENDADVFASGTFRDDSDAEWSWNASIEEAEACTRVISRTQACIPLPPDAGTGIAVAITAERGFSAMIGVAPLNAAAVQLTFDDGSSVRLPSSRIATHTVYGWATSFNFSPVPITIEALDTNDTVIATMIADLTESTVSTDSTATTTGADPVAPPDDVAFQAAQPLELPAWLAPRAGHSVSWTGTEMIVWGGWSDESAAIAYSDGGAYNPTNDTWRELAQAPLSGRGYHTAVWTGEQLLIAGGQTDPSSSTDGGASYDPATDTWQTIPTSGLSALGSPPPVEAVWTGAELVEWNREHGQVRAYSPPDGSWRDLPDLEPPAPVSLGALRWTGTNLVALAAGDSGTMWAASLSPDSDTAWNKLPPVDFNHDGFASDPFPSNSSIADAQLIVWSRSGGEAPTFLLDLDRRVWIEIATVPIASCEGHFEPLSLGTRVLVMDTCSDPGASEPALFDSANQTWTRLGPLPGEPVNLASAVWTGNEVLVVSTTCCFGTASQQFEWTGLRIGLD